uniref:hypothetical protein n=1 Tax=Aliarcobacter sp. TaxID=2321116 RepID=UPI004048CE07
MGQHYGDIDKYLVIVAGGGSDLVPQSGNYIHSNINQDNGGGGNGVMNTINPDVLVGTADNLMNILERSATAVEKINTTIDNKITSVTDTLSKSGIKVNGINEVQIELKTLKEAYLDKATEKINQDKTFQDKMILKDMKPVVNNTLDVSPLAEANRTIAQGVTSQIKTNEKLVENIQKKNEHLDFLAGKDSTLQDSQGNTVIPREIKALKDAEFHHDIKTMNTADIEGYVNSLDEIDNTDDESNELVSLINKLKEFSIIDIDSSDNRSFFKDGLNV